MSQWIFIVILVFVLAGFAFSLMLEILNINHKSPTLPDRLRSIYDEEKYTKSQAYDKAKTRVGLISSTLSTVILVVLLVTDAFGWLDTTLRQTTEQPILLALLFFGILAIGSEFIGLPFSIYNTFVIEEKYGFNRTTVKTFILDRIKGYLLGAIIGGGLMALIILIYQAIPNWFWLLGWILVSGFSIFFAMFYTSLIVPLFNKLTPLGEGELRTAIEEYADEVGFPLNNIYVMDSSKRSSKSNAYFSGLGRKKSIVLFDTLIEKHTTEELVSVLAHEVGHYKKKHVRQTMVLGLMQTGIIFLLLSFILGSPDVAKALGAAQPSFHINLIAFGLLFSPLSTLTGIGMNALSRKNEYQADEYAATTFKATPMQEALKKLSRDNLSDLEPHPLYVKIHYSHPPVLQRLEALDRFK